ncbi:hypothetical protein H072_9489 [Dactylellina haptotyla CBS 200.50]|uniref:Uncharacterized protein n=1 Tax=Dactylellina haptotyla (strain CBS 200.50) TaxID=1284197 RepID=S8A732_DACHA|nr:hypothetical protein H072_9489 [Dactylellina haptotyla CBS 200.50]
MFGFHKTLDVLTLFHSPRSEASNRVLSALKAANTAAEEAAVAPNTSAGATTSNGDNKKQIFELDVVEGPMTPSQLRSILDYVGDGKIGDIVEGANGVADAMKILEGAKGGDALKRPIVSPSLSFCTNLLNRSSYSS